MSYSLHFKKGKKVSFYVYIWRRRSILYIQFLIKTYFKFFKSVLKAKKIMVWKKLSTRTFESLGILSWLKFTFSSYFSIFQLSYISTFILSFVVTPPVVFFGHMKIDSHFHNYKCCIFITINVALIVKQLSVVLMSEFTIFVKDFLKRYFLQFLL